MTARTMFLPMMLALLAGCASAPLPVIQSGADPTDPDQTTSQPQYVPVTAGTVDYRPVQPKPWLEQNERVTPGARRRR